MPVLRCHPKYRGTGWTQLHTARGVCSEPCQAPSSKLLKSPGLESGIVFNEIWSRAQMLSLITMAIFDQLKSLASNSSH